VTQKEKGRFAKFANIYLLFGVANDTGNDFDTYRAIEIYVLS